MSFVPSRIVSKKTDNRRNVFQWKLVIPRNDSLNNKLTISNVMTQQQEQFKAYTPRRELFTLLSDKLPF
jgi:hypothetical protein